jgi:hypothetical protein
MDEIISVKLLLFIWGGGHKSPGGDNFLNTDLHTYSILNIMYIMKSYLILYIRFVYQLDMVDETGWNTR